MTNTTPFQPRDRVVVVDGGGGLPWRYGQEVSIEEASDGYVRIIGDNNDWWFASRFRRVVPEPLSPADDYAVAMASQTRVIVVNNDINLNEIPRRSYDHTKGDRRFTRPDAAVEYAQAERDRTGIIQVVRRDPGSYDFQELFLVQALGS